MTIFVDTGVFYADHDRSASRHEAAMRSLEAVYRGRFGQPITSDYVYDESVTLTLRRAGDVGAAKAIGERIRGAGSYPDVISLLFVDRAVFDRAVDIFERYDDHGLSFTDATTVAIVERDDIDTVLSFDDDFDGLADRVQPSSI